MSSNTLRSLAPVALFAYARPEHLATTVVSLSANPESARTDLYVFCDGARTSNDAGRVEAVRAFADGIAGFASVTVVKRERNLGLAANIIDGVTRATDEHGRVIVVEDDLQLSPHFLRYMNDGLTLYADDEAVASLHGYCYPVRRPLPETFFLRGADCWGWATWRRAWAGFRADGTALLKELVSRGLTREFDLDGSYPFTRMLRDQVAGRNDSWAIRWHASCFLADRLTLYPGRSLVHNIGNDATGTHCGATDDFTQVTSSAQVHVERQPLRVSEEGRAAFVDYFCTTRGGVARRAARALSRLIG